MKKKQTNPSQNLQKIKLLDLVLHKNVKIRSASKISGIKTKEAKSILKKFRKERKLIIKSFMNGPIILRHATETGNKLMSNEASFSFNSLNFRYFSPPLQKNFDELYFCFKLKENLINQILDGEKKLFILKSLIVGLNRIIEV